MRRSRLLKYRLRRRSRSHQRRNPSLSSRKIRRKLQRLLSQRRLSLLQLKHQKMHLQRRNLRRQNHQQRQRLLRLNPQQMQHPPKQHQHRLHQQKQLKPKPQPQQCENEM